jgi:hypothetical protein
VRRFAGLAVVILLVAPEGLRLAAAGSGPDAAAILCAIACGHEATAAACCPMRAERADGPSFQSCGGSGTPGVVSPPAAQPGLLLARLVLSAPIRGALHEIARAAAPRVLPLPAPDHVPLLLS